MRAPERAYRDVQIVLARAAGATYAQIGERFGVSERHVARIIRRFRETSRAANLDRAHDLAMFRRRMIYETLDALGKACRAMGPYGAVALEASLLAWMKELDEIEQLLGMLPREIDWKFDGDAAVSLWHSFSKVLERHDRGDELYWDLREAFRSWATSYRAGTL